MKSHWMLNLLPPIASLQLWTFILHHQASIVQCQEVSSQPPNCNLYDNSNNEITMANVGDTVRFRCNTLNFEGDSRPSVHLARGGIAISDVKLSSFIQDHTLSEDDIGMNFTCVMTHSSLSQPRTCLLLSFLENTITQKPPMSTSFQLTSPASQRPYYTTKTGTNGSTKLIIFISVVVFLVIVIIVMVAIFLIIRYKKRNSNHSVQVSSNYTAVNNADIKHEYLTLKTTPIGNSKTDDNEYAYPELVISNLTNRGADGYEVPLEPLGHEVVDDNNDSCDDAKSDCLPNSSYENLQRPVKAINFHTNKIEHNL